MIEHKCDGCRYKGEHQEMMFKPFGVCLRERNLIEAEKAYRADICPYAEIERENTKENDMDEYIKKSDLKDEPLRRSFYPAIVKSALEAVQSVDIVMCKECEYSYIDKYDRLMCHIRNGSYSEECAPDDFCSRGRKGK